MAKTEDTNPTNKTTMSSEEVLTLARKLDEHADGIESLAARELKKDLYTAARTICALVKEVPTGTQVVIFQDGS